VVSGLNVNFHKSMLFGVNVAASWLTEAASILGCSVGRIPFLYLGLPIGGDPRRLSFWDPVVNTIHTWPLGWNSRLVVDWFFLNLSRLLCLFTHSPSSQLCQV
jgi:mannosylglycoprotein endo-beta-mannosidase